MDYPKMHERGYEFSCRLIDEFRSQAPADDAERHIWWQLFDAGYSIGANASESDDAESGQDFIHKFLISLKEARETLYWLRLLAYATRKDVARTTRVRRLYEEGDEITAVLVSSIRTKKARERQKTADRKAEKKTRPAARATKEFWFNVPD
jgi:four helix bundle protein